ncbi:MAG: hypothetical protein FWE70_05240 [Oscillospiraceae bacterium]|nr:hypothetical protein [Oscillospiraceae bacterium]
MRDISELDYGKKWEYLKRYYDEASAFYGSEGVIATDAEVGEAVRAFKERPMPKVRREYPLTAWRFMRDRADAGIGAGYYAHDLDDSQWEGVTLPHAINDVPDEPAVYGKAHSVNEKGERSSGDILRGDVWSWYRAAAPGAEVRDGEAAYLSVGSANVVSDVWVNDYPVMMGHWGLFPYEMEVTGELRSLPGQGAIAVRVTGVASNVAHMFHNGFQYAYYGKRFTGEFADRYMEYEWDDNVWTGLADEVRLRVVDKVNVYDAFVHTESLGGGSAKVRFGLTLRNQRHEDFAGRVRVEVSKWLPTEGAVCASAEAAVTLPQMEDTQATVTLDVDSPETWSPETPSLYMARIIIVDGDGREIDDMVETFGIRTFGMRGQHFYLNGEKTVLKGTHDLGYYHGEPLICPGDAIIARDILTHKRMGANCTRWPSDNRCHHTRIARYCDQMGLMLTWAGYFEVWTCHPEFEAMMLRDVGPMIRSLRNRPSIATWEMADEALWGRERPGVSEFRRRRFYDLMYRLTSEADPTRPIVPQGMWTNDALDYLKGRLAKFPPDGVDGDPEEGPVYFRSQAVYDIHTGGNKVPWPKLPDEYAEILAGAGKPVIFTEFTSESFPSEARLSEVYGDGPLRWGRTPWFGAVPKYSAKHNYGREIGPADWKVTQAHQAIKFGSIFNSLRKYPDVFGAYSFCTLFDFRAIFYGVVDAGGHAKLAYWVMANHYAPTLISALHGYVAADRSEGLRVDLSNHGGPIKGAKLTVTVRGESGAVAIERTFAGIESAGDVSFGRIAELDVSSLPEGLYSFGYALTGAGGEALGRSFEMAYLD